MRRTDLIGTIDDRIKQSDRPAFEEGVVISVFGGTALVRVLGSGQIRNAQKDKLTSDDVGKNCLIYWSQKRGKYLLITISSNHATSTSAQTGLRELYPPTNFAVSNILGGVILAHWDTPIQVAAAFEIQTNATAIDEGATTQVITRGAYAIIETASDLYVRVRSISENFLYSSWTDWILGSPGTGGGGGGTDADAVHVNVDGEVHAITEKTTPISTDILLLEDSAASYAKRRVQIANLPGGSSPTLLGTRWEPLAPPASPSAYDDEFDGQSGTLPASGLWTESDFGSTLTVNEAAEGLILTQAAHSGYQIAGLYQMMPAGDFTITTYVSLPSFPASTAVYGGLALWVDPTDSTKAIVTFMVGTSATLTLWVSARQTSYTGTPTTITSFSTALGTRPNGIYMRIRKISNLLTYEVSWDGLHFEFHSSGSLPVAGTITPTAFGVALNTNDNVIGGEVSFPFFRYVASDVGAKGRLNGQRISVYA